MELHLADLDGAFLPLSVAAQREGLFDYTILVALKPEVVGFVAFTPEELAWLYVDPACHRQGIGRALARAAQAPDGTKPLTVEVLAGNLPALSLYRSLGFSQEKIVRRPYARQRSVPCHRPLPDRPGLSAIPAEATVHHFMGGMVMTIRQALEQAEHQRLDPRAAFSDRSRGRPVPEPEREDDVRTCYQRDTDRIVHSKAFRRLMHKTQVFLCPEGDHYRTRMTHTLEVARIARTITRALNLNEDLTEAIALGHDLGHTPFGHAGEDALSQVLGKPFRTTSSLCGWWTFWKKMARG